MINIPKRIPIEELTDIEGDTRTIEQKIKDELECAEILDRMTLMLETFLANRDTLNH